MVVISNIKRRFTHQNRRSKQAVDSKKNGLSVCTAAKIAKFLKCTFHRRLSKRERVEVHSQQSLCNVEEGITVKASLNISDKRLPLLLCDAADTVKILERTLTGKQKAQLPFEQ